MENEIRSCCQPVCGACHWSQVDIISEVVTSTINIRMGLITTSALASFLRTTSFLICGCGERFTEGGYRQSQASRAVSQPLVLCTFDQYNSWQGADRWL